jgi:hypothetical protein
MLIRHAFPIVFTSYGSVNESTYQLEKTQICFPLEQPKWRTKFFHEVIVSEGTADVVDVVYVNM